MKPLNSKRLITAFIVSAVVGGLVLSVYHIKEQRTELSAAHSRLAQTQKELIEQKNYFTRQSQQLAQTISSAEATKKEQETLKQKAEAIVLEHTKKQRELELNLRTVHQNQERTKRKLAEAESTLKRYKHAKEAAEDQRRALYITKKKGDQTISETMSALQLSQLEAKTQQELAEIAQQNAQARSQEAQEALEQLPYLHSKISSLEAEVSRLRYSNVFLTRQKTHYKHKTPQSHIQHRKKRNSLPNSRTEPPKKTIK